MRLPESPLFSDPIYNGAADPVIIWNKFERQWWIVYTQRMPSAPGPGVTNVHGSKLGVASSPDGHDWLYRGELEGLEFEHGHNTFWAPEIICHEGVYHMYVTYVQGISFRVWSGYSLSTKEQKKGSAARGRAPFVLWRFWKIPD